MRPTVEKFLHWLDVSCPDFIWFARPCTIESSLQELRMSPTRAGRGRQDAVMADREYQEVTSLRIWSARGYQKQIEKNVTQPPSNSPRRQSHGRLIRPSLLWMAMTATWTPDQCQYGVTLPDEHGIEQYIQKSIRLKCTDETMALDLACTCPGNHWHLPLVLKLLECTKLSSATHYAGPGHPADL